jgi:RNA-binding protein
MPAELTSRQRKHLRSVARRLRCDASVGKGGASEAVLGHVRALLGRRELIKVRLLDSATNSRQAAARELAEKADAALVDLVGRVVVLYRPNEQLPREQRVQLPPP